MTDPEQPAPYLRDADFTLWQGDARDVLRGLPAESIHCCVTSPPYWGLRDYGDESQLGLEATPDEYVAHLVEVFREIRRVLRRDGTVWLNLGDSYSQGGYAGDDAPANAAREEQGTGTYGTFKWSPRVHERQGREKRQRKASDIGLKPKDMVGIPWKVAFALQADGWYLRADIIWSKPNPMPESVSDRPTKAHEYLFLLSKSARYFYDADAIRDPVEWANGDVTREELNANRSSYKPGSASNMNEGEHVTKSDAGLPLNPAGRNKRSVWEIATESYVGAHFAVFPQKLVEPCIKAGTSEHGCCPECGAPWERVVESEGESVEQRKVRQNEQWRDAAPIAPRSDGGTLQQGVTLGPPRRRDVLGWKPTCRCARVTDESPHATVPCVVLDPFLGSGTTALVARRLGRHAVGIELNPEYAAIVAERTKQLSLFGEAVA